MLQQVLVSIVFLRVNKEIMENHQLQKKRLDNILLNWILYIV